MPRRGTSTCSSWATRSPRAGTTTKSGAAILHPRKAANFGIGGDRTQHVLWRIQNGELEGIEPKVIVLMIGTNNASNNTPDEIAQGITAIVPELRERLPNTKILLARRFPQEPKARCHPRSAQVRQPQDRQARRRLQRPIISISAERS